MDHPDPSRPMPPETLAGTRLRLRALGLDDVPLERELSRDPDVVRWTYYPPNLDDAAARSRIELTEQRRNSGEVQRYAVIAEDDVPLATCGISGLQTESPEIFYAVLPQARGHGVATEVAELLTAWAFDNGYSSVVLDTIDGNAASERVAEKTGFHQVERVQDTQRGDLVWVTRWVRATSRPPD